MFSSILMVCTGNICRSPMAERMLADHLADTNIVVSSAGTYAMSGYPAQPFVEDVLADHQLSAEGHKARQLSEEIARNAELILVMEAGHRKWIGSHFPEVHGRSYLIGHWRDQEIPDPYQQPLGAYERTWKLLDLCISDWIGKIRP